MQMSSLLCMTLGEIGPRKPNDQSKYRDSPIAQRNSRGLALTIVLNLSRAYKERCVSYSCEYNSIWLRKDETKRGAGESMKITIHIKITIHKRLQFTKRGGGESMKITIHIKNAYSRNSELIKK